MSITSTTAASDITTAILGIDELQNAMWSNLAVSVNISNGKTSLCSAASTTVTTIELHSDYGNLPFLGLLDGTYTASANVPGNLSLSTNQGNGTLYPCSNQGVCDTSSGVCQCLQLMYSNGTFAYQAASSDGRGNVGTRGDCGYLQTAPSSCLFMGNSNCSGHGICRNTSSTCACQDGWYGLNCELGSCPSGPAFFDEPIANDTAHQPLPCSGNGLCNATTGLCECREGFTGPACDIKDCTRNATNGDACSGHGICTSISRMFQLFGYSYGNVSTGYVNGGSTWDANLWYECLCSAKISDGFFGHPKLPAVGSQGLVSGQSPGSPPLPGWSNWDCSKRNCPKGPNTQYGNFAAKEEQRVLCRKYATANISDFFVLQFYGFNTKPIHTYFSTDAIKAAIEFAPTIGNVSIFFPDYVHDNISTACSQHFNHSYGGFLVRFDTEGGDLPLLEVQGSAVVLSNNVTVSEHVKGTSVSHVVVIRFLFSPHLLRPVLELTTTLFFYAL